MQRHIAIVIDELNLIGFDPRDRFAAGAALEREIQRLFRSEPPAKTTAKRIEQLATAPITLRGRSPAADLGTQLAARIHRAVSQPQRRQERSRC